MAFINGITLLLIFQLLGEIAVRLSQLPVPGPVAGMLLLFIALLLRGRSGDSLERAANGLLGHLSLLFIPAGVGLMVHLHRVGEEWLPVTVAIAASTVLTLALSGLLLQWLLRRRDQRTAGDD
ncbi:CidA/LrgA family protein [Parahaliea mediterranea]|uniref:CidA/LrgA family protein n=1 Tax=Parahaliea mediterranea TaxID=651086 RepID=A0A939DEP7_9GAMM|nr:CidA/LrgA family protein [Parahaliea mediterranea]MBN7796821.1 CidA/LrgA family protein [Parahaliea mediterranea]